MCLEHCGPVRCSRGLQAELHMLWRVHWSLCMVLGTRGSHTLEKRVEATEHAYSVCDKTKNS